VFPMLIEESPMPVGEGETIGSRLQGYDLKYRQALAKLNDTGRILLGLAGILEPSSKQMRSVDFLLNVAALNVYTDPDGVVRRLPRDTPVEIKLKGGERRRTTRYINALREIASKAQGLTLRVEFAA